MGDLAAAQFKREELKRALIKYLTSIHQVPEGSVLPWRLIRLIELLNSFEPDEVNKLILFFMWFNRLSPLDDSVCYQAIEHVLAHTTMNESQACEWLWSPLKCLDNEPPLTLINKKSGLIHLEHLIKRVFSQLNTNIVITGSFCSYFV